MLHSPIRVNKKYYPQTILEECKYEMKKNTIKNLIYDDLDFSSSDESDSEPDNEFDNGPENELTINFDLPKVRKIIHNFDLPKTVK